MRRARLDRRHPQGDAVRAAAGPGVGGKGAGGRAVRPGLDLRPRARRASTQALGDAHYPPLPAEEYERFELLALEKETLGIFLSSHPLAEVRHLLRKRTDCSLAEVASKPDGAWVTVGGLITQAKRIRTKSGDPMMFATLDDLEGQVEMLIFNSAYASNESNVGVDRRVIVRGRVDHKDRGETKLVVQEVEPFEPTPEEIAAAGAAPVDLRRPARTPRRRRGIGARRDQGRRTALRREPDRGSEGAARAFPGQSEVLLEMVTASGPRRLRFGAEYRVSVSGTCARSWTSCSARRRWSPDRHRLGLTPK